MWQESEIRKILKDKSDDMKENTLITYATAIKTITADKSVDIDDDKSIIKYIHTNWDKNSTRKIKTMAMITFKRALGKDINLLSTYFDRLYKSVEAEIESGDVSEADKNNLPTTDDMDKVIQHARSIGDQMMELMILMLKTYKFRNEIRTIKIRNVDGWPNYIKDGTLYLNERKSKTPVSIKLTPEILKLILAVIRKSGSDYLFVKKNGNPFTQKDLTAYLNKLFIKVTGKKVGTSRIRKGLTTEKLKGMPSYKELNDTASVMGHSVNTHLKYYKKNVN